MCEGGPRNNLRVLHRHWVLQAEESGTVDAKHPLQITHTLSINGSQLEWAIVEGFKCVETRKLRPTVGWYTLHVTSARAKNV